MAQSKVLVSACLVGKLVRYDGKILSYDNKILDQLIKDDRVILCCPEVDGGLSTPRSPAEIVGDKVINSMGKDVTKEFIKGANIALNLAKKHNIKVAILKSNSPSCSNKMVYDGTFSKTVIKKDGITAKLLKKHGIKVFNEFEIDQALRVL